LREARFRAIHFRDSSTYACRNYIRFRRSAYVV